MCLGPQVIVDSYYQLIAVWNYAKKNVSCVAKLVA